MLRLYEYSDPVSYDDFENYLFRQKNRSTFDFANDKVTVDGTDYRISSIRSIGADGEEEGEVTSSDWFYVADKTTDGSIRFGRDTDGNYAVQKLVDGSWGTVGDGFSIME